MIELVLPSIGVIRKALSYDPDTGVILWVSPTGRRVKAGDVAGSVDARGYRYIRVLGRLVAAHRIAWAMSHGKWPAGQIDHVNRNKGDNRIENLRECSPAENQQNMGLRSDNTSGSQGVSFHRQTGKWRAYITTHGVHMYLGLFRDKGEAIEARVKAKRGAHTFSPEQIDA